ncbi:MAG: hypothetical protein WA081_09165 [Desulfosalsimonadaceae bacterium]
MKKESLIYLMLVLLVIAGCSWYRAVELNSRYGSAQAVDRQLRAPEKGAVSFQDQAGIGKALRCLP